MIVEMMFTFFWIIETEKIFLSHYVFWSWKQSVKFLMYVSIAGLVRKMFPLIDASLQSEFAVS